MKTLEPDRAFRVATTATILALAIVATLFVGSSTARNLGQASQEVRLLESAVGSVKLASSHLALGVVDPGSHQLAHDAARSLELLATALSSGNGSTHLDQLNAVVRAGNEVTSLIDSGDPEAASATYLETFVPASNELTSALSASRNRAVAGLDRVISRTGRIADLLKLVAFIAIPAAAVWMAFRTARRYLARKKAILVAEDETRIAAFKDEFLANVSHELRTPLTGIVGFAHLLAESPLSASGSEAVSLIISESAELSRMVDDLLTSARADAGLLLVQPESISVPEQVAEVTEFMKLLGVEVEIQAQEARIIADSERFRQIVRNLLVNAHQHGLPGIRVTGQIVDDRYVLHVVDHGPGVRGEIEKRLFTRFYHPSGGNFNGSLGLGLSVVHTLSQLMGCEVTYRRIRGETHFVLSAPLDGAIARLPVAERAAV